jgi:peptidoglycan/xylan/chitin deacetylase (PgdA/CDA1 family)
MRALHRLKTAVVATAAWVLYVTGVLHLLVAIRLRSRAVVLMYHRVIPRNQLDEIASHPGIVVEAETFESHLRFLRRHMNVVSAREFVDCMAAAGGFPPRTCLVTFDDGWADSYSQAYPLLRKHGVPALFFLAVGYIGTQARFWQETLIGALVRALRLPDGKADPRVRELLTKVGCDPERLVDDAGSKATIQDEVCRLKHVPEKTRGELLDAAARLPGSVAQAIAHADGFLHWQQAREMAAGGMEFGSHSSRHELLTMLRPEQVARELASSKEVLERELSSEAWTLSYPNGSEDADVRRLAAECGYRAGFGTEAGLVDPSDDRYAIRRVNVHQGSASTVPLLMARIAGVF